MWHKLLFGTDYPFTTVNATLQTLDQLNTMFATGEASRLDPRAIEEMIHRDTLGILGLSTDSHGKAAR